MADATISRVRMRDLTRLGRAAASSPMPSGHRQSRATASQSGQVTPRTSDLMASPI